MTRHKYRRSTATADYESLKLAFTIQYLHAESASRFTYT